MQAKTMDSEMKISELTGQIYHLTFVSIGDSTATMYYDFQPQRSLIDFELRSRPAASPAASPARLMPNKVEKQEVCRLQILNESGSPLL